MTPEASEPRAVNGHFMTTQWGLIAQARDTDPAVVHAALSALCQIYWQPIFSYVRRKVGAPERALDLTQGFFTHLLEKQVFTMAHPARGKFRTFLLSCCDHYLCNEWEAARAQKRGGGRAHLSFDFQQAEEGYAHEPVDRLTPEALFERRWALTLLETTSALLEQEYERAGNGALYRHLKGRLTAGPEDGGYAAMGAVLGMTEAAVKKAAQRLRARYGQLLRQQIAETVTGSEEVEEELRDLLAALAR
jgi:DNA-directed RNA polymerase specialized sigma24 family protein